MQELTWTPDTIDYMGTILWRVLSVWSLGSLNGTDTR